MTNKTLSDVGERTFIETLLEKLPRPPKGTLGIGDDCAIIHPNESSDEEWLVTTDAVLMDVHITDAASAEQIGHKAAARTISDIAAMGGTPLFLWINLVMPCETPLEFATTLMQSASKTAQNFNAFIMGGDTTTGPTLEVHAFCIGQTPSGTAVTRAGAKCGDQLYVTGALGGSILHHHLNFSPRVKEGRRLREMGATSMIDLSDGLFTDLRHLLKASQVGAILTPSAIPISDSAKSLDGDPIQHACCDGEDYELLVTFPTSFSATELSDWENTFSTPLTRIGEVTQHTELLQTLDPSGTITDIHDKAYEHFI